MASSIYLKKDYSAPEGAQDVLVIQTNYDGSASDYDSFESYMMDLLGDLQDLQEQAEKEVGHFDRIDIRT